VRLNSIAHRFRKGHRIRIGISPMYWPWIWPSPEPVTLEVFSGQLALPVRNEAAVSASPLGDLEAASPPPGLGGAASSRRFARRDIATGRHLLAWDHDPSSGVVRRLEDGLEFGSTGRDSFTIIEGAPSSAVARTKWSVWLARGDWAVRVEAAGTLSADPDHFHVRTSLRALEGAEEAYSRGWSFTFPRHHV
jgi:hypothetical protein